MPCIGSMPSATAAARVIRRSRAARKHHRRHSPPSPALAHLPVAGELDVCGDGMEHGRLALAEGPAASMKSAHSAIRPRTAAPSRLAATIGWTRRCKYRPTPAPGGQLG